VLLVGGLFLIYKATHELYERIEHSPRRRRAAPTQAGGLGGDRVSDPRARLVFSLDSVITAVGMARAIIVMMAAMIIAVGVMFAFAGVVSEFVNRHPSMKILALAFLLLIGVLLTADAFGQHINRGYVYFAMAFSLVIELLNMRFARRRAGRSRPLPRAELCNLIGVGGRDTRVPCLANVSQSSDLRARSAGGDGWAQTQTPPEESASEDSAPFAGSTNKGPAPFASSPSAGFAAMGQWVAHDEDHRRQWLRLLPQAGGGDWTLQPASLDRLLHHQRRLARRDVRLLLFSRRRPDQR
jgi:hypothetical protein